MDAKDRLRRYLEQRRELGESEFVLDALPIEDVLKLVGARATRSEPRGDSRSASRGEPRAEASGEPATAAPPVTPAPAPPPPVPEVRFAEGATTDWRAALRNVAPPPAGGSGPSVGGGASGPPPRSPGDASPARPAEPSRATSPGEHGAAAAVPSWLTALDLPVGLQAGRVRVAELAPDIAACASLDAIAQLVSGCQRCALFKSAKHPVPGEGHPQADLLCVGEAPGATEDEQGRPFVGEAGQLLTKILGAIQLSREEVYICNVLKHRPPGNRDPLPEEVAACQPYLLRQIELVQPKVILALGRFAAQTLLQTATGIGQLRGRVHQYHGVPLIVTYHPAALLRNEQWKRPTWEDVKLARRILDAARAAAGSAET